LGRVTTPPLVTITALLDAQLITVPLDPTIGRVKFPVTLPEVFPEAKVIARAALSSETHYALVAGCFATVMVKTLVSTTVPFTIVAVRVTVSSLAL